MPEKGSTRIEAKARRKLCESQNAQRARLAKGRVKTVTSSRNYATKTLMRGVIKARVKQGKR